MANVYINPNGGSPKFWTRNDRGAVIFGSLNAHGRQADTTTVTETAKRKKGYEFIAAGSWKAIEAVFMGGVASITQSDRDDAVLLAQAVRNRYPSAKVYDPPRNVVPDPAAPPPPPVPTPPPAAAQKTAPTPKATPKTVQQSIKEWKEAPDDSGESAWSW